MSPSDEPNTLRDYESSSDREGVKIGAVLVIAVAIGVVAAYQFVGPPPPKTLVFATGVDGGGYHAFGTRYAEAFSRSGIELQLTNTAGSIDNLQALRSGAADVALVQGGTAPEDVTEFASGIASLYFEPLWVFHRAELEITQLSELAGLRIQVGAEGSGTRAVALDLLQANGVDPTGATFLDASSADAADALLAGDADAALLIMSPRSETIGRLMAVEGEAVRLLDVDRHLGYERTYPYLAHVVLGEGVLDFERNLPGREIDLVAPTASLVAREDLHPALAPLFIRAAEEIHGGASIFAAPDSFPSPDNIEVPLSRAAEEYFKNGPSFLYRVFPFAVAATIDRLKIILLPLLTLLLPLLRVAPPIYRWRIRSKIYRWYKHIDRIERRFAASNGEQDLCLRQLRQVEREVAATAVPPSYMEELHNLRMHLERASERVASAA